MEKEITKKQQEVLEGIFRSFKNGLHSPRSEKPRKFLEEIGLDYNHLSVGFNSGQFHHRTSQSFKEPFIELGLLVKSNGGVNAPDRVPYSSFGRYSIVFPLYNKENQLINLYAYRFAMTHPKGAFLNQKGVYPYYPKPLTKRLYITSDPIQGASLNQSGVLENREAVLALYNGDWKTVHSDIITELEDLEEIVFINCSFPKEKLSTNAILSKVGLEDSILESYLKYQTKGLHSLITTQITKVSEKENVPTQQPKLTVISDTEFIYQGEELHYNIFGALSDNSTLLEMDFELKAKGEALRIGLDLLNRGSIKEELEDWLEENEINQAQVLLEIASITKELQTLKRIKKKQLTPNLRGFSTKQQQKAKAILSRPNLFEQLKELLQTSGIIGEEQNSLLLFIIATSYKFKYNLHAVIQAEELSSASELVLNIADCIPEMDRYSIDLTTSRSFRYYGNSVINEKLLVIPDYTGVTSNNGIQDLKRLQSRGTIVNDAPKKTANGRLNTIKQQVHGHTSSIGACKNTKKYFENEPRTVIVEMDNSPEKLQELMEYDCRKMAGLVDEQQENEAKELLQYIIKNIHPMEVVNPFANKLMLPVELPGARTLTVQLLNFVSLITLFNQHQAKEKNSIEKTGKLITTQKDVELAIDLFLNSIVINIDELDATTRTFFEQLKAMIKSGAKGKKTTYSSLDIRQELRLSKTTANRYLKTLVEYEYLKKIGFKNTGYHYKVVNWNNLENLKNLLKDRFKNKGRPIEEVRQLA